MSIDPKGGKMGERTHNAPSKEYTHEHGKINYDDKISVPNTSHDLKNAEQMEKTSAHPSRFSPCIAHDLKNSEQTEKTIVHPSRTSPCTSHDLKNSEQMEKTSAHPSRFSPCISPDLKNSEQTEKTIAHPSRASPCTSHDLKNSEKMEKTSAHPSHVSPCTSHDLKNSEKTEKTSAHPSGVSPCTSHDLKNSEKTEKTSAHPSRVSPSHDLKNSEQTEKTSAHPSRASPCEIIKVHPNSQVNPSSTYKPHNEYKKPEGGVNPCPLPSPKRHTNTDNPFSMASNQASQMSPSSKTSSTTSSFSQGWSTRSSNRSDSIDSTGAPLRPHTGGDVRWDAITSSSKESPLNLTNFRLLKRLGYGDIGSVYLVQLRGTNAFFAMKVMDKGSLASRNKLLRAQTEREILGLLDHPFLPTLYTYFETDKFYCLVMEFCSGGNLHTLRQKQPNKYFTEEAARFYASEVLLALEYLHMLGIVYRDLKPENVLVREEGHIMLSDFDLSLRCSVSPTLVKSSSGHDANTSDTSGGLLNDENMVRGCMQPSSFFPRLLPKKNRKSKSDFGLGNSVNSLPELMAEPTNVRSMSFVGTHEYLAPEIIRGEGHGSAVDWWTFGIFLYELLHGITPFKGNGNRATLFNVVGQPLKFPETPQVSATARDLIKGLLVKEPQKRIAYKRGATEIKQHPFFEGVNWALVRSVAPPYVPEPVDFTQFASKESGHTDKKMTDIAQDKNKSSSGDSSYVEFEYF